MSNKHYLIVGSGLSGAVVAERLASQCNQLVTVIEKRAHLGGNCFDHIHSESGIRMCTYGAHLFHTNSSKVWNYINSFCSWTPWEHKVLAFVDDQFVNLPVNINTVNSLCNESIDSVEQMNFWLMNNQRNYDACRNSEEVAKARLGNFLYDKLIKHYTYKQWGKYPSELASEVLERIPIRNNYDDRYFTDKYQALPNNGYSDFIEKLFDHPNIVCKTNIDFDDFRRNNDLSKFAKIIYTGPIDHYFNKSDIGKLEYRGIDFNITTKHNIDYYQPNSVVNYPSKQYSYTRIIEHKHFLNQESEHTVIVSETSNDGSKEPYYPVPNESNKEIYLRYQKLAKREENSDVYFLGRLANYKYYNMDEAISNALVFVDLKMKSGVFSVNN